MIVIIVVHVIAIIKKIIIMCVCFNNKYREFCEEDSIILKETKNSYFNVENIRSFSICCKKLLIKLCLKN